MLCFALLFALPWAASAQVVTAHEVKISIKGLAQTTNDANDLKPDPFSGKTKDLFEICTGGPAAKDEGIFVFFNCEDPNDNLIAIVDTDPLQVIELIGSIDLDLGDQVQKTKNQELKSVSVPAEIGIDCGEVELGVFTILDINFKDLEGDACPNSAQGKIIGTGSDNVEESNFIVDQGSSINLKPRSGSINAFPPLP
jgi:hypothetical protein